MNVSKKKMTLAISGIVASLVGGAVSQSALAQERALCGAIDPDILLIDVMMPKIDGFEVARQLAEIRAERMPTIVFVTASSDPAIAQRATDSGHAILVKPMRQEVIDALLEAVANREPSSSGSVSR